MYRLTQTLWAVIIASVMTTAQAHDELESHSAHVHGEAMMTIASQADLLEISLISPAVNLLGFEHQAETVKEIEIMSQAEEKLAAAAALFTFQGTVCTVKQQSSNLTSIQNMHDANKHIDTEINYQFSCDDISALTALDSQLVKRFEHLHEIHVQWLVNNQAGTTTLDENTRRVSFN